jgi:isopentenyldiphosphate isomerase
MNLVDIFDEDYNHIGVDTRENAHLYGYWHRSFSCWIVNPEKKTIIWQRRAGQDNFPRKDELDVTGGHYEAGEKIEDGVRELNEEMGLNIAFSDLIPIKIRKVDIRLSPTYWEREFQHVFLLFTTEKMKPQASEVSEIIETDLIETLKFFETSGKGFVDYIPQLALEFLPSKCYHLLGD